VKAVRAGSFSRIQKATLGSSTRAKFSPDRLTLCVHCPQ
jgi:hypothetical protein